MADASRRGQVVHIDAKPSVRKQILRELQIMHDCVSIERPSSNRRPDLLGAYRTRPTSFPSTVHTCKIPTSACAWSLQTKGMYRPIEIQQMSWHACSCPSDQLVGQRLQVDRPDTGRRIGKDSVRGSVRLDLSVRCTSDHPSRRALQA